MLHDVAGYTRVSWTVVLQCASRCCRIIGQCLVCMHLARASPQRGAGFRHGWQLLCHFGDHRLFGRVPRSPILFWLCRRSSCRFRGFLQVCTRRLGYFTSSSDVSTQHRHVCLLQMISSARTPMPSNNGSSPPPSVAPPFEYPREREATPSPPPPPAPPPPSSAFSRLLMRASTASSSVLSSALTYTVRTKTMSQEASSLSVVSFCACCCAGAFASAS